MTSRDEMEEGAKLAQAITSFMNRYSTSDPAVEAFVDTLTREHRTLQQLTFGLFLKCIERWSESPAYDLRNEWTVERSREIIQRLGVYNLRPPFI